MPAKMHPDTIQAMQLVRNKGFTVTAAAHALGIHRTTLSRALHSKSLNGKRNKKRLQRP